MTRTNVRWLLILTLVFLCYFPINRPWGTVHNVATALDACIPFVPVFVIPYVLFLPFQIGTLLYAARFKERFQPIALAFLLTWLISYGCYFVFQTTVDRPPITPNTPLLFLVSKVYGSDPPYNCFPSLHTAGATLCALTLTRLNHKAKIWAWSAALSIIVSTVCIKQHYLLDLIAALLLSVVVFYTVHHGQK